MIKAWYNTDYKFKLITSISPVHDFRLDGGILFLERWMKTFKITVAYDGTDFHGWQVQPDKETICSRMQKIFEKVFNRTITLTGASRTDSGVHALGQIVKFKTDLPLDKNTIMKVWNNSLPKSILIRSIEQVDDDFNPHKNVYQKNYYYHIFLKRPLPFISRYGYFYEFIDKVDFNKFNQALQLYVGEHDFASFCKIENKDRSTIRKIDNIYVNKISRFGVLQIIIIGKSFLRFQIRRMVGYALDVARRPDFSIDYLKRVLDNPNPQQILLKAKSCGLCLYKVIYKNETNFKK